MQDDLAEHVRKIGYLAPKDYNDIGCESFGIYV
jgi:hypothetical protein